MPEGYAPVRWLLRDVTRHRAGLHAEMPTQHLALTQQNYVGPKSNIKVAQNRESLDKALEENRKMRLKLWS